MIELAGLLVLGFFAQWLAWRVKVPAILPLIIIGLLVGPISTLFTADGSKFIDGDKIFHGEFLFEVIAISVGLILFEGGLTLKLKEVRTLGKAVRNLIFWGTIVTTLGTALAAHYIVGLDYRTAFIFGALVIVTGPTVIGPILRNVRPNNNVTTLLKWEGILIDPVGALAAILIYEFVVSGTAGESFTFFALKGFLATVLAGVVTGVVFAFISYQLLQKKLIPHYLRNIVMLGIVITTFAISDLIRHESGLLAVTLLGMILANLKVDDLRQILSFKEDVTLVLISFLFVMLSSRMHLEDLEIILRPNSIMLFMVIVFLLRPIVVFLSTWKSELNLREKLFVSYISPRGIVAAGVASIFTVRLVDMPVEGWTEAEQANASLILPLTFMIIVGTVIIQGLTAKPMAKLLNVTRKEPNGILFLGANEAARYLARFLKDHYIPVLLTDTSKPNINEAKNSWLPVFEGSLINEEVVDDLDLSAYGQLMATTSNTDINSLACRIMTTEFGKDNVFRLISNREIEMTSLSKPTNLLFNGVVDFISLTQIARTKPRIELKQVDSIEDLNSFIHYEKGRIIPLFHLTKAPKAIPITTGFSSPVNEGDQLAYIRLRSAKNPWDKRLGEEGQQANSDQV